MRKLLFLIIFLSTINLATALDLSDYPDYFFDGDDFTAKIVVGEKASTMDVTSAIELIPGLQQHSEDRIRGSFLDSDVSKFDLQSNNIISIGTPCDNTISAEILEIENCDFLEEGEGYIYLYESPLGKAWLVILGKTSIDTRRAANLEIMKITN